MKNKPLILTLAALVILAGIYGVMTLTQKEPEEKDETVTGGQYVLSDIDPMTIMSLKYTMNGVDFDFKYTVNGWLVRGNEDYPLDQSLIETMVNSLCAVTSDRLLTGDPSSFTDYGLDPASIHVEMEDSGGVKYAYNIGDKNPTTSKFYFNVDGSDDVYTVPTLIGRSFANYPTLASLLKLPSFPAASMSTTSLVTITRGEKTTEIVHMPDGDDSCYSSDYKWFLRSGSDLLPLSEDRLSNFLSVLSGLGFQEGADFSDDPAVLAKYGLDDDYYTVSISYESASRGEVTDTFYLGEGENGKTYGRLADSNVIGTIINKFDFFGFDYETYKADDLFKMPIDSVDRMTALLNDSRYVIKLDRTTSTDSEGKETTVTDYTLNGDGEVSGDAIVSFFNTLRDIVPEGDAPVGPSSATPALESSFKRNTAAFTDMTFRMWEYDSSFYLTEFNGETKLINKRDAEALIEAFMNAIAIE